MTGLPVYPYPTTYDERVRALTHGTPAGFRPYVSGDPDPYGEGLLAGAERHNPKPGENKA